MKVSTYASPNEILAQHTNARPTAHDEDQLELPMRCNTMRITRYCDSSFAGYLYEYSVRGCADLRLYRQFINHGSYT